MPARLTEEDFEPVYMDIHKNPDQPELWPKLVKWVPESPFVYGSMQISVTVTQRQMTPASDWEFIVMLKPNDKTLTTGDEAYASDRFAEEIGTVTLPTQWSFEDAIDAIYAKVEELVDDYT